MRIGFIGLGSTGLPMAADLLKAGHSLNEKHGVPREKTLEVLTQSIFPAPLFVNYGRQIANHAYEPARFRLALGLKDANPVLGAANKALAPMPLAGLMLAVPQGR